VEVSLNGGESWLPARLAEPVSTHAWRAWSCTVSGLRPGAYTVLARATDEAGNTQPAKAPWNLKGYGNNQMAEHVITVTPRPSKQS
jgi:hypothetical protein